MIFGSYANNKMDVLSDIDLLVIGNQDTIELQKVMGEIQKSFEREINVISMTPQEYTMKRKSDIFLKSIQQKENIAIL